MPSKKKIHNALAQVKLVAKLEGKDILQHIPAPKRPYDPQKRFFHATTPVNESAPRKKKNNMREKELEKQIIWNLEGILGCTVTKAGEDSTYNKKYVLAGMSDLIVFVPKTGVVFMEVKTETGKQRASQSKFEKLCSTCNLSYYIVRSVEEAINVVKSIKKC